jgi:hypothetical protein
VVLLYYDEPGKSCILDLIHKIKAQTTMLLSDDESYQLFMAVRNTQKLSGDIAEVGVYRGGSARLICEAKGDRVLHLFDTFEGLPEIGKVDHPLFRKGKYAASLEEVRHFLQGYTNVYFYKGLFPGTAKLVEDKRFSIVHLDADLYESTLDCLQFFYPRMTQGGVLMAHDFNLPHGVRKAFVEFFVGKPESIIEMSGTHCLVVKTFPSKPLNPKSLSAALA